MPCSLEVCSVPSVLPLPVHMSMCLLIHTSLCNLRSLQPSGITRWNSYPNSLSASVSGQTQQQQVLPCPFCNSFQETQLHLHPLTPVVTQENQMRSPNHQVPAYQIPCQAQQPWGLFTHLVFHFPVHTSTCNSRGLQPWKTTSSACIPGGNPPGTITSLCHPIVPLGTTRLANTKENQT